MLTCPNLSCGKLFTKPLRALNLRQDPADPYEACPYCLTEIISDGELSAPNEILEQAEEAELEEEKSMVEPGELPEKSSECPYHLGYLSERSSKEPIPDKCMICKDIVPCMLKKMKV